MRKVLFITYFFPPRPPEFAGRHAAALAKYLPEFGWEPVILTAALPREPDGRYEIIETPYRDSLRFFKRLLGIRSDERLLMYVAELKKKFRIKSERSLLDVILRLSGAILAYPDPQKGWRAPATRVADELLKREPVDAMLSISPPVTSHMIAADLKRKYGVPWVAYFLDLWTQNHYYPYGRLRRALERRLETKTMACADILATVSQPLAELLGQLHQEKPVESITLGFDPEEMVTSPHQPSTKFTVTYTGNIYPGKQSPEPLFKALAELISEGAIDINNLEVRFYGPELGWVQRQIARYHLQDVVRQFGFVPRQVSLDKQRESHILLLLDWVDPNEPGVYTAKVFEYLAAGRPILAIGGSRNGVLPTLLEATGSGVHCPTTEETKGFLKQAHGEYELQGQVSYRGNQEVIMKYSYKQMAHRFSELLSQFAPTMS